MVTEAVLDRGRAVQVAERLEEDNPDWVIMYGVYSREFVAFPVYPDAPDNCYCSAKDPAALDDHIRETERRHGRVRLRMALFRIRKRPSTRRPDRPERASGGHGHLRYLYWSRAYGYFFGHQLLDRGKFLS